MNIKSIFQLIKWKSELFKTEKMAKTNKSEKKVPKNMKIHIK